METMFTSFAADFLLDHWILVWFVFVIVFGALLFCLFESGDSDRG